MAGWLWVAFVAVGAGVGFAEVWLLGRMLQGRIALGLAAKLLIWAVVIVLALAVNALALVALIAGSAPMYVASAFKAWRKKGP